jgi:hypothetical protein
VPPRLVPVPRALVPGLTAPAPVSRARAWNRACTGAPCALRQVNNNNLAHQQQQQQQEQQPTNQPTSSDKTVACTTHKNSSSNISSNNNSTNNISTFRSGLGSSSPPHSTPRRPRG